jgi:D-glycero-alpha-D-manno-heptose 1-phosphate guanylyltransferase
MTSPCIVLAGGMGTRLRSAVPDLPKCLAPIAGHPFLEWQLRSLAARGIERFVLALGHGADQVLKSLAQPWARSLSIYTVTEREPLGTGGAARFAMDKAELDEALIVNGDTFLGGSLKTMLAPLDLHGGEFMRIATVQVPDRTRFGGVAVDAAQRVTAFLEKGQVGAGPINAGLYRIHRNAFNFEALTTLSMETQVMPRLISEGALQAREIAGPFIDIGVPDDYRQFDSHVYDYFLQD